ncbi:uroporphyrinogen decarboxylase [Amphiplicatus metriothermophilus]|uniref:Uroporphyrinogen decarboxylase n=1 Tax=Amphiplicatus metriothermophilus TaxID=1519374 RepID=A0A239PJN6_9PROT|nr:uroporphyrinogen decarboxylase [Amphiplicatus metriothermophilus]MBB5517654.1 uroporphyrinogen decarboxylase [Amphiplicatus metriothermophilus]SNT68012.1 uroporphyrinogen decarboxylase [Amphiplicatus metriothermophilus]
MTDQGPRPEPLLVRVLKGERTAIPPVWFMRQAGRYLPEYRALREEAGSFLDLCRDPTRACEVTLQPVRRFDLDAAILFADILLIPHALGQDLSFVEGEGPRLAPAMTPAMLDAFRERNVLESLAPVFETVRRARAALAPEKALIGFAGAPWTVATYMLAGGPSRDPSALRARWYGERAFVEGLIDLLVARTADYLIAQIDAGADAVQLFDSWAGGLPEPAARALSVEPMRAIAAKVKAARPGVPVIFFPKGAGALLEAYAALEECDAVGLDTATPPDWALRNLAGCAVLQGGLDPLAVVAGGAAMRAAARRLLRAFAGVPYVFNTGHGLVPETPPAHVAALVDYLRSGDWKDA